MCLIDVSYAPGYQQELVVCILSGLTTLRELSMHGDLGDAVELRSWIVSIKVTGWKHMSQCFNFGKQSQPLSLSGCLGPYFCRAFIGTAVLCLSAHSLCAFLPCPLIDPCLPIERAFCHHTLICLTIKESIATWQYTIASGNDPDFGTTNPSTTIFLASLFSTDPGEGYGDPAIRGEFRPRLWLFDLISLCWMTANVHMGIGSQLRCFTQLY